MKHLLVIAYIDPASGSILLQALIAGVIGLSIRFRKVLTDVFKRFADRKNGKEGTE